MSDKPEAVNTKVQTAFSREIGKKAARKLEAQHNAQRGVWFGLGMMGLIGWSVVVPTLLGALVGIWLDHDHPGNYSWTLMLLVTGLVVGCLNAWHWVSRENKEIINKEKDNNDE